MKIQRSLRPIILIQLLVPLVLLIFGIYHGFLQALYRAGVIHASSLLGIDYYQGLTLHGIINAIVLTTFFAIAFGNALVSELLGVFLSTFWALVSMGVMLLGSVLVAATVFAGKATVLYTFYPPLKAHPIFYIGLVLFVVGSWIGWWVWIPAYLKFRKENPGIKTPLPVVGIFSAFIIWQMATLPVAYEVIVLLIPWSFGWVSGVNIVLARTLFWFFGHPLVYFWLLPAYVMFYTMLPRVSGGKLYSDFAGRFVFLLFIVLSCPLGLHHQFADPGISSGYKFFHTILTSLVSIPSLITAFTIGASLEYAGRARGGQGLFAWWTRLPFFENDRWLFSYWFSGLVIFIFGGVTGLVNASYNVNLQVHNTAWIPAHFHLTVGGPVFLGILGMSLFMIGGLTGKRIATPAMAMWVPYLWMVGLLFFSGPQFVGGLLGEPRRTNAGLTYLNPASGFFRPDLTGPDRIGVIGAILMVIAMIVYFVTVIRTLAQPSSEETRNEFAFPVSEPLHDEDVPSVRNFKPWVIAGVVAILIAYIPPLVEIVQNKYQGAPGYRPDSPVAEASR